LGPATKIFRVRVIEGQVLQFGSDQFPNWTAVIGRLQEEEKIQISVLRDRLASVECKFHKNLGLIELKYNF